MERTDRLRKTPRQARSRSTVDAILDAADRVLRSDGYAAASTNRVARVAGFSVGSLYQYFDDKQAVVGALLDQAAARRGRAHRAGARRDGEARATTAACDRSVRMLLAERRRKAHLLRVLDAHAPELCAEPPLRHALRVQAKALADPLHRFAAAHFGDAFARRLRRRSRRGRRASSTSSATRSRWMRPSTSMTRRSRGRRGRAERDGFAKGRAAAAVARSHASCARPPGARGSGAAFADATARARRVRESRSALVRGAEIPPAALEPTVFLVAVARRSRRRAPRLPRRRPSTPHASPQRPDRLLQACLDASYALTQSTDELQRIHAARIRWRPTSSPVAASKLAWCPGQGSNLHGLLQARRF